MEEPFNTRLGWTRRLLHNSDPDLTQVQPHGVYGVGIVTAHPVGLLIVAAMAIVGLWYLPQARWFFLGAAALGILFGIVLRLRHRQL
jgi:hypothetical protein